MLIRCGSSWAGRVIYICVCIKETMMHCLIAVAGNVVAVGKLGDRRESYVVTGVDELGGGMGRRREMNTDLFHPNYC